MSRATRATKRELIGEVERLRSEVASGPTSDAHARLSVALARLSRFYADESARLGRIAMRWNLVALVLLLASLAIKVLS